MNEGKTRQMIGFFEFGDVSVHKITFWASCCMIVLVSTLAISPGSINVLGVF